MPLTRQQKEELVKAMTDEMKSAKAVVFADYQGLSVADMDALRKELREAGVKFQITKKTLMKISAKEAGFDEIPAEVLEGPVGAAFSMEDEIAAAKILDKFGKKHKNLKLRGALFQGKVLTVAETKELASLPGYEELIAKFIFLVKSPISGFHGVMNNTVSGFVRVLEAIREKQA